MAALAMAEYLPQVLLSNSARERCIANLKALPSLYLHNRKKVKQTASVLVPLCVVNNEVSILYTLRSPNLKSHSGQVSFPGGKTDKRENVVQTALRETEEELGIRQDQVDVWCQMPETQGRNRDLLITPIVGVIRNFESIILKPNESEVAEVFTVPLRSLCDKKTHGHLLFEGNMLPVFTYDKHKIWGITGFVTHLFLQCLLPSNLYEVDFTRKQYHMDELMPSKL